MAARRLARFYRAWLWLTAQVERFAAVRAPRGTR